jgi:hypothetical protein
MASVQIGDQVRVSESVASEYAGRFGVVVAMEQRRAGVITMTECEVEFKDGVRRMFPIFQLTPIPSEEEYWVKSS